MFFIGVNLTFLPMHSLGLAGMPRRIPIYPSAYVCLNSIASIGAGISFLSALYFVYILYIIFTTNPLELQEVNKKNYPITFQEKPFLTEEELKLIKKNN